MAPRIFILAIEDEIAMQEMLRAWLENIDHDSQVDVCDSIEEARQYLATTIYDIIFLDLKIKDSEGIETFLKIKSLCIQTTAIILLTGTDISESYWKQIGADGYIKKTCLAKNEVIDKVKAYLRMRAFRSIVRQVEHVNVKLSA